MIVVDQVVRGHVVWMIMIGQLADHTGMTKVGPGGRFAIVISAVRLPSIVGGQEEVLKMSAVFLQMKIIVNLDKKVIPKLTINSLIPYFLKVHVILTLVLGDILKAAEKGEVPGVSKPAGV
jgi:hypothetical protein